jgi:hypothetical protein
MVLQEYSNERECLENYMTFLVQYMRMSLVEQWKNRGCYRYVSMSVVVWKIV